MFSVTDSRHRALQQGMSSSVIPTLSRFGAIAIAAAFGALTAGACDLPDKDVGSDPDASTSVGPTCGGEPEPADECQTCMCNDGAWECVQITTEVCGDGATSTTTTGADGTSGTSTTTTTGTPTCEGEDPSDECTICTCEPDGWNCTYAGCATSSGPDCEGEPPTNGCNACECIDGEWACTDEACPPATPVVCSPDDPLDPLFVTEVSVIDGAYLYIDVEYSGGCAEHIVGTCWDEQFQESDPVQIDLFVTHESNDDPCEAIESQTAVVDLEPIRTEYLDTYGGPGGTVIINVDGRGPIEYTF